MEHDELKCNFCNKTQTEVRKLIAGNQVYICDECIYLCFDILEKDNKEDNKSKKSKEIPSPKKIKSYIDKYIIGQDYAKLVLAVAVYNHYKRLDNPVIDDVEIDKSNILLIGPTGSGKCVGPNTEFDVKIPKELYDIIVKNRNM